MRSHSLFWFEDIVDNFLGNNYGIGEKRKAELKGSCKALSIDSGRCLALDNPDLQDNPKVWWDEAAITAVVKEYVSKWKVDVVSHLN